VPNRFVRRIKSGEIDSIEELKSEFKELAKLTHPDLRGPGAEADFVSVRAEYEAALRGFERHRFGARDPRAEAWEGREAASGSAEPLSDVAWACLALLLKRGFPKASRHEKEKLRYEYARWRFAQALGPGSRGRFAAFESELLDMKAAGSAALAPCLELLAELLDYRGRGLAPMRTQVILSIGSLRSDPRVGAGFRGFADALARDLGLGGEIGAGGRA
jgi:hypothetical protein